MSKDRRDSDKSTERPIRFPGKGNETPGLDSTKSDAATEEPISEEVIIKMLNLAGPRPTAPSEQKGRVFNQVEEFWQAEVTRRAQVRRRRIGLAAAALILLSVGWWWLRPVLFSTQNLTESPGTTVIATVKAWHSPFSAPFEVGEQLAAGRDVVTRDDERAALDVGGISLRLDRNTRIRLLSGRTVELSAGRVYVDTGEHHQADSPGIEIRTALGNATDIGTQFSVELEPSRLRVAVREGLVNVAVMGMQHETSAGTELTVDTRGNARKGPLIENHDWSWAVAAAPPFELEGATLAEALRWVGRETGLSIEYQDPELAEQAESIVTHGSLVGLTADQAPELIVATAGLAYTVESERLYIYRPEDP